MSDDAPIEQLMPLAAFAATLQPRVTATRAITPRQGAPRMVEVKSPGSPDEIWLAWLKSQHGLERHTLSQWRDLIKNYADQPAHPTDPNYGRL